MKFNQIFMLICSVIMGVVAVSFLFQNCSKVSFKTALSGSKVRAESICSPNSIASCSVDHGLGQQTCLSDGSSFGACTAQGCDIGFQLNSGICAPIAACTPGAHRDCGSSTTYAVETCAANGAGYGPCVNGDCKPGFSKNTEGVCIPDLCTPKYKTPCSEGVGTGFQTCDDGGNDYGLCVIEKCPAGYALQKGACVLQRCPPKTQVACIGVNGDGVMTCGDSGLKYGDCKITTCHEGFVLQNVSCVEYQCQPHSKVNCHERGGKGERECRENGVGFSECHLHECDNNLKIMGDRCEKEHRDNDDNDHENHNGDRHE